MCATLRRGEGLRPDRPAATGHILEDRQPRRHRMKSSSTANRAGAGYSRVARKRNRAHPRSTATSAKPAASSRRPNVSGFDRRVRVAEMDQPEEEGADAVEAGEDAAGPQHPPRLRQQPVLQRRRRDVVQHRERHHAGERAVRERHRRPVAVDDAHAGAVQPLLQRGGRGRRPPPGPSAAASGRGAGRS